MAVKYNKERNIISMEGHVDNDMLSGLVTSIAEFEDNNKDKDILPLLTIELSTPGGSAYACFGIVDLIEELKEKVVVKIIGRGQIMSAGVPIWLSGSIRETTPNTSFMIHDVFSFTWGKTEDMKEDLVESTRLQKIYFSIIGEHTTFTKEDFDKIIKEKSNYFYTGKEAMERLRLNSKEALISELKNSKAPIDWLMRNINTIEGGNVEDEIYEDLFERWLSLNV